MKTYTVHAWTKVQVEMEICADSVDEALEIGSGAFMALETSVDGQMVSIDRCELSNQVKEITLDADDYFHAVCTCDSDDD